MKREKLNTMKYCRNCVHKDTCYYKKSSSVDLGSICNMFMLDDLWHCLDCENLATGILNTSCKAEGSIWDIVPDGTPFDEAGPCPKYKRKESGVE